MDDEIIIYDERGPRAYDQIYDDVRYYR